jgi:hypothetical protein
MSIPASAIVNVTPGVIAVGGSGINLVGLFLTNSTRVPIGAVQVFTTQAQVAAFFGATSAEATLATVYFAGYDGSTIKPAQMLFAQYATAAVGAYLRSASLALTIAQLQAMSGVLTISVNGTATTSSNISLAAATSYSNAAAIIQAAFTNPGFTVSYDSTLQAFVFTNATTGAASTISFASGTLAAPLALTQAAGAAISQGAAPSAPGAFMDAAVAAYGNFASFTTTFQPSTSDMLAFSAWTSAQNYRFMYAAWEAATTAIASPDTSSFGYQLRQLSYGGTINLYDPNNPSLLAAFVMGSLACLDFSRSAGRTTLAFRSNAALLFAGVTNQQVAANLAASGYNFYGGYATASTPFNFLYPGQVSGSFAWADSMANQIWMNANLQLALMQLLTTVGSIPYNADGYAMVEAAMLPVINAAISYGAIRSGVTLTATQLSQANTLAGADVSSALTTRGWYAKCLPATPQTRAARGPLSAYLIYTDGGSVQTLNLNSIMVA